MYVVKIQTNLFFARNDEQTTRTLMEKKAGENINTHYTSVGWLTLQVVNIVQLRARTWETRNVRHESEIYYCAIENSNWRGRELDTTALIHCFNY